MNVDFEKRVVLRGLGGENQSSAIMRSIMFRLKYAGVQ